MAKTINMDDVTLYLGDCLAVLPTLPAKSVQCVVTSPPYWGLRDYQVDGQIGLEETPEAYVAHLVAVFREVRRVLRDDGTVWLNLGDSYFGGISSGRQPKDTNGAEGARQNKTELKSCQLCGKKFMGYPRQRFCSDACGGVDNTPRQIKFGMKPKDLVGIPWRVAFALQADGWTLRSEIIWHKPNPMPESVTDRPTKSHEQIFLLTKSARYYYDAEEVREPVKPWIADRRDGQTSARIATKPGDKRESKVEYRKYETIKGANRRSVWTVAEDNGDIIAREECPCGCGHVFEIRRPPVDAPEPSHEYIFLLTKRATYYYDNEAVKEPFADERMGNPGGGGNYVRQVGKTGFRNDADTLGKGVWNEDGKATGRNRRSVWTVATQPYKEAHFATFPPKLIEPCILAGTSERGCCPTCGKPWERTVEKTLSGTDDRRPDNGMPGRTGNGLTRMRAGDPQSRTVGWHPGCECGGEPIPCTVLDPFGGAGTTALVAIQHGRRAVSIELNAEYIELTRERLAPILAQPPLFCLTPLQADAARPEQAEMFDRDAAQLKHGR